MLAVPCSCFNVVCSFFSAHFTLTELDRVTLSFSVSLSLYVAIKKEHLGKCKDTFQVANIPRPLAKGSKQIAQKNPTTAAMPSVTRAALAKAFLLIFMLTLLRGKS